MIIFICCQKGATHSKLQNSNEKKNQQTKTWMKINNNLPLSKYMKFSGVERIENDFVTWSQSGWFFFVCHGIGLWNILYSVRLWCDGLNYRLPFSGTANNNKKKKSWNKFIIINFVFYLNRFYFSLNGDDDNNQIIIIII